MARNVILLSIDALRVDHLSVFGYDRDTTPHIDDFADRALSCTSAFSASSHTREAVPAMLTGRHPNDSVDSDFSLSAKTIAGRLRRSHATAAFHSNPYLSRAFGYDRDFDAFYDDMVLGSNRLFALAQRALQKFFLRRGEYHTRAEEINERSLAWIDSIGRDQPFLLWNHYMDVHGPYNPPDGSPFTTATVTNAEAQNLFNRITDGRGSSDDIELALDLYDGEIVYLDRWIGHFLSELEERNILEDTVVVITADHGELFGEHGRYAHPRYLYPALTHVPLIIAGPDFESGLVETTASTIDILPTLLDILGEPHSSLPGISLLDPKLEDRGPAFSSATAEGEHEGLRRFAAWDKWKGYLLTRDISTGIVQDESVISVKTGDVVTTDSLHDGELKQHGSLRQELLAHSESKLDRRHQDKNNTSREIQARLEALGYK